MRAGFDSTMLSLLLNPLSRVPVDPATGEPTDFVRERLRALISRIQRQRGKIIVPTPSVAEILTIIGPTSGEYFSIINRSRVFEVRAFDEVAAFELAFLNRDYFAKVDKKSRAEPYQKIKVDRQILAICRVAQCDIFYTDDGALIKRAESCGMNVGRISDLPIPDEARQHELDLEQHEMIEPVEKEDDVDENSADD